jgi:hypothetical protein
MTRSAATAGRVIESAASSHAYLASGHRSGSLFPSARQLRAISTSKATRSSTTPIGRTAGMPGSHSRYHRRHRARRRPDGRQCNRCKTGAGISRVGQFLQGCTCIRHGCHAPTQALDLIARERCAVRAGLGMKSPTRRLIRRSAAPRMCHEAFDDNGPGCGGNGGDGLRNSRRK